MHMICCSPASFVILWYFDLALEPNIFADYWFLYLYNWISIPYRWVGEWLWLTDWLKQICKCIDARQIFISSNVALQMGFCLEIHIVLANYKNIFFVWRRKKCKSIDARRIFLQLGQLHMDFLFSHSYWSLLLRKLSKENNFICARRIFLQLWQLQMELLFRGNQAEIILLPLLLPLVAAFFLFRKNCIY